MIKISKKSQYGLRAMVNLAKKYKKDKNKKIYSVKLISKEEGIPFNFLEKIILQLEKAKLVKGKRGIYGGYILSKSPQKISVGEIVSVLEYNKRPVNCSFCGRRNKCSAKNVWIKLENSLNKTLKSITLKDLI